MDGILYKWTKEENKQCKKITYEEERGVFLFEDYILMDDNFEFIFSLFYYVDLNGNIISKAFSNVVEETHDAMLPGVFTYNDITPPLF